MRTYDAVAIGCGPFNLGFAALATSVPELSVAVFEARPELSWHPGMMFDDAKLQLSFLADLVSLIEPTHPLSFLAYLRDVDRLYPFYVREAFHPSRREYEAYLRWAAARLPSVKFSHRVEATEWDEGAQRFRLLVTRADGASNEVQAKVLVVGVGTEPFVPSAFATLPPTKLLHSADYLHRAADIGQAGHVTVVGSGQSGAEVALDLLRRNSSGGGAVSWLTRTQSFAPLDYTKLTLEMTTPAYVHYFHGLPERVRDALVAQQWQHYKGISSDTLEEIHGTLYERELLAGLAPVELRCGVDIETARVREDGRVELGCRDRNTNVQFEHVTWLVVAATGYRERSLGFLRAIEPLICRDRRGRLSVRLDHSLDLSPAVTGKIFVANADLHSHGVAAPDLGIGAFRNATILNSILGRPAFRLPQRTAFTSFVPPVTARNSRSVSPRLLSSPRLP
jgi:lysine N6-hydroxylase